MMECGQWSLREIDSKKIRMRLYVSYLEYFGHNFDSKHFMTFG